MGRNAIDKEKRTRISQNGYILDKEAVRRKQLLLQSFGKGRNWGGGVCRPHFPCLIACCWFLQMLLDSSKSVIKTWLFCPIATSHWLMLKKQPTYISFIPQLLPVTETPQETECLCGNPSHEKVGSTPENQPVPPKGNSQDST